MKLLCLCFFTWLFGLAQAEAVQLVATPRLAIEHFYSNNFFLTRVGRKVPQYTLAASPGFQADWRFPRLLIAHNASFYVRRYFNDQPSDDLQNAGFTQNNSLGGIGRTGLTNQIKFSQQYNARYAWSFTARTTYDPKQIIVRATDLQENGDVIVGILQAIPEVTILRNVLRMGNIISLPRFGSTIDATYERWNYSVSSLSQGFLPTGATLSRFRDTDILSLVPTATLLGLSQGVSLGLRSSNFGMMNPVIKSYQNSTAFFAQKEQVGAYSLRAEFGVDQVFNSLGSNRQGVMTAVTGKLPFTRQRMLLAVALNRNYLFLPYINAFYQRNSAMSNFTWMFYRSGPFQSVTLGLDPVVSYITEPGGGAIAVFNPQGDVSVQLTRHWKMQLGITRQQQIRTAAGTTSLDELGEYENTQATLTVNWEDTPTTMGL